jgi:hypothetical protein
VIVTTSKILALKALERVCGQECVDWATTMLEQGAGQRSIGMLAGMTPPFNHFEIASLRDRALFEIGAKELSHSQAIRVYASELALDAVAGDKSFNRVLDELAHLCVAEDYAKDLYDFYLLQNAWEDLQYRGEQWYLLDATRDNIDQLIRDQVTAFAVSSQIEGR